MISALIFSAHLVFVAVIFTKKWQDESLTSAFINLALIVILFTVGWSISTSVVKLMIDNKGFGLQFDADAISLTILAIAEYFFYRFYYKEDQAKPRITTEDDKEM
jgi:formate hydrogenlyase subunit 3/multisubunit Na+/H+ antiporter MnhD subunit